MDLKQIFKKKILLFFKYRMFRFMVAQQQKKYEASFKKLTQEQQYAFDIAIEMIISSKSELESNPTNNILYVKNGLKLLQVDDNLIHIVNGKYSYMFMYEPILMDKLRRVYCRHKERIIKKVVDEISTETKENLKNLLYGLKKKTKI